MDNGYKVKLGTKPMEHIAAERSRLPYPSLLSLWNAQMIEPTAARAEVSFPSANRTHSFLQLIELGPAI